MQVLKQARRQRLLSPEHFTVDGAMIEAWAGQKSFQPKSNDDARKRLEEVFGGLKTVAAMRKTKFRGRERAGWLQGRLWRGGAGFSAAFYSVAMALAMRAGLWLYTYSTATRNSSATLHACATQPP